MGFEVDFLPVGNGEKSGDAIALRFGNLHGDRSEQHVVVIDGGFKESGEKLVGHIQEYYDTRSVDLVISTHPDNDHASGLEVVLEELQIGELWMHLPWNHTADIANAFTSGRVTDNSIREHLRRSLDTARGLEAIAGRKGIPIVEPFAGVSAWGDVLTVLGPTEEFYEDLIPLFRGTPEAKLSSLLERALRGAAEIVKRVAETWGNETLDDSGETSPENNTSVILQFRFNNRSLIFTGDAGITALTLAADELDRLGFSRANLGFVQVPHHGSQRNVGPTILDRLVGPKLSNEEKRMTAFVSVASGAAPKHPSKKVTNAFRRRGAPVHATNRNTKWYYDDAPPRSDYSASTPLPFYEEVEE